MKKLILVVVASVTLSPGFFSQALANSQKSAVVDLNQKLNSNQSFKYDQTKKGWTLEKDAPFDGKPFIQELVKRSKNVNFFEDGCLSIGGGGSGFKIGQRHLEYLEDHQGSIPREWRDRCLKADGTVWILLDGEHVQSFPQRYVPHLCWTGHRWSLIHKLMHCLVY